MFVALLLCLLFVSSGFRGEVRIFLIGDSTVADKPEIDNPERGWGQVLPWFFDRGVVVENHARNGRSTKSFISENRWQRVFEALRPGDYVFIQFGHNDAKREDTTRYAPPHTSYKQNLLRFVRESRSRGAIPVLITPVNRRRFDDSGRLVDLHGDYPKVVREVAKEEDAYLIDLHDKSKKLFENIGPEATKRVFLWVNPGEYESLPSGKQDNTHFTKYGALEVAQLVADGIKELDLPLAKFLEPLSRDSLPGLGKVVGLDYFFNCEWKENNDGSRVQYHYVWEDSANSGFSELGRIIDRLGANITTVHKTPTMEDLKRLSIYMIVDPDTPEETKNPNYISQDAIEVIVEWVKSGGVLMLMGNDKGNVEFEHFNQLGERFGIHFNEDSHHRVVGKNFDTGKCDSLPAHPIFSGVKLIFIKELCSLRIEKPAEAILTENGLVLMAVAHVGKGTVFAIGDPWLYNEYIDNRKLPDGFENAKAGKNLFRWLLTTADSQ